MSTINSIWANMPIDLSKPVTHELWAGAEREQMKIPGGYLWAKNDAQFLYLIIDFIEDTHEDSGVGDYFWFTFDADRNGTISPRRDVNYGVYPNNPNKIGRQFYLGPGRWTGLINEESESACRYAFEPSPNLDEPHRIWKLKIKMRDLNVSLIPFFKRSYIKFGLRMHSTRPNLNFDTPKEFFTVFKFLHTLHFSRKPVIPAKDLGPVIGSVGLIPTTVINETSGRATTDPSYYVKVVNAAFGGRLNLMGNREKISSLFSAPTVARRYKILYHEGTSGSFEPLKSAWTNYRRSGSNDVLEYFSADADGFYELKDPSVDYSIDDLLVQFDSKVMANGLHQFKVEFYTATGTSVISVTDQLLTLYIDNSIPEVSINAVKHAGREVVACDFVNLRGNATDGVVMNFDAHDAEGNLLSYIAYAKYGDGHTQVLESANYPGSGLWTGVTNHNAPTSGVYVPPVSCAYSFNVRANARTTNGYAYVGYNTASRFITIIK